MQIHLIDPREHVEVASRVLQEAWQPPCLRYTLEYLRWQFTFPGPPEPVAALAHDGDQPAGFFAAVPRRMRRGGRVADFYLLSFLAVRPAWRGLLVTGLYRVLLDALAVTGHSVVAFAQPGAVAEQLILGDFAADYRHRDLGLCKTFGYVSRQADRGRDVVAFEATDDEFLEIVARCHDDRSLSNHPTRDQLEHYRADPRGRKLLVGRLPDGQAVGAAMVARLETLTAQGPQDVATIDSVFLVKPDPAVLAAFGDFAGNFWRSQCGSPVVTVPNLSGIDAAVLRQAGFRETPSRFQAFLLCIDAGDEFLGAEFTNLEVV